MGQRLAIELRTGTPINGTLTVDGGPCCHFVGWLELIAALQATIGEPPDGLDEPADPAGSRPR